MFPHGMKACRKKFAACATATALSAMSLAASADAIKTATPIKHVIIIVGENRSFDHVFATYVPKNRQRVRNLLSERIINADGSPGPKFAKAHQYEITSAPNDGHFFSSADLRRIQCRWDHQPLQRQLLQYLQSI
jgi:phospholipase C